MSFSEAITTCLRKYATFSGRASRPEYWFFFLFMLIASLVAAGVDAALLAAPSTAEIAPQPAQAIVSLGLFLPNMAAAFRRMHDTGRSGWFVLLPTFLVFGAGAVLIFGIGLAGMFAHGGSMDVLLTRATLLILIPTMIVLILSPLIVLFWLSRPSQPGTNAYGPNPTEVTS